MKCGTALSDAFLAEAKNCFHIASIMNTGEVSPYRDIEWQFVDSDPTKSAGPWYGTSTVPSEVGTTQSVSMVVGVNYFPGRDF